MAAAEERSDATWVVERTGVSYRQLDYWIRRGYLRVEATGSGRWRTFDDREVDVARRMAALVDAGLVVAVAAVIARRSVEKPNKRKTYRLTTKVAVTLL